MLEARQLDGTQIGATQYMMDQGSLKKSDNPLDLAIDGLGFFAIQLPDGRTAYTRDGQFYLDPNRQLVNNQGYKLVWQGQIPAGAEDVHINPDGSVMVLQADNWTQAGSLQLSRFTNASGLLHNGQNLWLETEISGAAQAAAPGSEGMGSLISQALEQSNVNLAEDMVTMTTLQRSFEMSLRAFQQTDEMLSQAIHIRRG
jgi:flagellar basal-body rod protein FlgG